MQGGTTQDGGRDGRERHGGDDEAGVEGREGVDKLEFLGTQQLQAGEAKHGAARR